MKYVITWFTKWSKKFQYEYIWFSLLFLDKDSENTYIGKNTFKKTVNNYILDKLNANMIKFKYEY